MVPTSVRPREGSTITLDDWICLPRISELVLRLSVFSHFLPQIPPTSGEPKTLLWAPNECAFLHQHFHRATELIPQHFCWDRGQQTRSPQCEHKAIDTVHREPDNPTFHLHSRLSSITGILSLVSSLVARRTNRSLGFPPSLCSSFQPPHPRATAPQMSSQMWT